MKLRQTQPVNLTDYIDRIGDRLSRENFPDERVFEQPPEERLNALYRDKVAFEPLFDYEQPTRRQIAYVLAGCCVMVLLVLVVFTVTR